MSNKILSRDKLTTVTGASGHLGANLVRALISRGLKVRALVHLNTQALDGLDLEMVNGDILDLDSLKQAFTGADVIFHLAARISIVNWDRKQVEAVNIDGVKNVVTACIATGVKRLIHTSSFHAIKQEPFDEPLDESRPLLDVGYFLPYNNSKAEGERIVRNAVEKGLNAVIITPTGMIGPYDFRPSHFGMSLLAMAKAKFPALVGAGLNWVDTRDVAEGMIRACEHAQTGAKYILSGHWVTLSDIAQWVTDITGAKAPQVVLPMWLAKTSAPLATLFDRIRGRRSLFTPISMIELESNKNISHAKASKELGYEPRPLQRTIADTVDWFRSYGFLGPNYP